MIAKWEGDRLCWGHQQMRLKDPRPPASGQYLLQHAGHPQVTSAAPFPVCKAKWGITATKEPLVPAKQLYKPQLVAFTPRILFLEVRAAIRRKQHATRGLTHFLRGTDRSPHRQAFSWPGSQGGREALERWRCRACESWSVSPPPLREPRG